MRAEEYHAMVARGMTEEQLQGAVVQFARNVGWLVYHTRDSRRSTPGFPDLVMVHPARGVLWRELKTEKGRVSVDQRQWLERLSSAGEDAAVWRPADWISNRITKELMGR